MLLGRGAMSSSVESIHGAGAGVFQALSSGYTGPNFAVRMWNGSSWRFSELDPPAYTIVFNNPESLRTLVVNPTELSLGEAFIHSDIDVEGDLLAVFDLVKHLLDRPKEVHQSFLLGVAKTSSLIRQWLHEQGRHSVARDRASIAYHYDQPVEFYRLFLGKTLVYSCAYFKTSEDSLDEAEENKLELICKKLRLAPLERFLDVGCGWGGMILHAALHHGVYAHGVTLSEKQAETVRQRIREANLMQSCAVDLQDYRAMGGLAPFDKISSIGMFEHVGLKNLPQYFSAVRQLLKPGGVFLNHGIGRSALSPPRSASFIDRYVFPDGELVTLNQALAAAEEAGFEVRDVENLREHYDKTLCLWVGALERNAEAALKLVSQTTYRIWRLYMAGSAAAFRRGDLDLYQTLLSRPSHGKSGLPLTRADWYRA